MAGCGTAQPYVMLAALIATATAQNGVAGHGEPPLPPTQDWWCQCIRSALELASAIDELPINKCEAE